jgi:hypothetical protein
MTQGAVYDAVNAIEPKHYRPYLLKRRFGATASENAAVATAAYEVLSSIVQGVPQGIAFPNRQTLLDSLRVAYNDSLDDIDASPFKAQGIAAGHAAAEAMIASRAGDGRYGPSLWRELRTEISTRFRWATGVRCSPTERSHWIRRRGLVA